MDPELLAQLQQLYAQPDATRVADPDPDPPSFLRQLRKGMLDFSRGVSDLSVAGSRAATGFAGDVAGEYRESPEIDPRLMAQPASTQVDNVGIPRREIPATGMELLGKVGNVLGEQTLGRALALGTMDPRLPETQAAYRSALGFGADLTPVIGDIKAAVVDAPQLFGEGRPIAGSIALASAVPILGLPVDLARSMGRTANVAGAAAEAAPTIVKARHYGQGAKEESLLVGRQGSGRPGTESVNDAQQARTYFYLPEVLEAQTGRPFRPEPQFAGDPSVDLDLDIGKFVNAEGQTQYLDRARDILRARKAAGPNPNINPEPMRMDVQNLAEEMMIADGAEGIMDETRGVAAKFSDTELPRGRANREIIEATDEFDGATFSTEGDNLAGQPLYATARPAPGGRKDWKTLPEGEALTPAHLNAFRKEFADELSDPEASIGTWHDKATGRVAIDVVETIPDRAEAIRRGKERGQDAIFDLGAMEEIGVADDVDRPLTPAGLADAPSPQRQLQSEETAQAVVASVPDADAAIASLPARLGARLTARQRRSTEGRSVASRARRAQAIKSGLTPDELAAYTGANVGVRKNIERAYSSLPTPEVFAQAAIRGAQSRGWYLGSGRAIREIFGQDAPRMTALIAAQSPNKSVEENLRFSLQTWENWNAAGRPTDPDELRRLSPRMRVPDPLKPGRMKSVPTPDAIIQSPLPADFENSITALSSAEDVLAAGNPELLSGPKVGPFYANLLGGVDPVTNDTHMARGYGTLPGGVGTKARTLAQNAMIGNAARAFEEATGVAVDRREIQEMSWAYIRGLTNASAGGSALETIEKAILDPSARFAGGRTVQEQVENSVSMGHLMNEPKFAQQLERMGLRAPEKPQGPIGVEGLDPLSADPNALRELGERIDIVREATRRKKSRQKGPLAKGLFSLAGAGLGLDAVNQEPRR